MEQIWYVGVGLEMLAVSFSAVHRCVPKRAQKRWLFAVAVAATFILAGMMFLFLHQAGRLDSRILVLAGLLCLLPSSFLYQEQPGRIWVLICLSCVYSLLVFAVSFPIGRLFAPSLLVPAVFMTQTILYLFTAPFFFRLAKTRCMAVLRGIPFQADKYVQYTCLAWAVMLSLFDLTLFVSGSILLKIIYAFGLALLAIFGYALIRAIVQTLRDNEYLQRIVYVDTLSGLSNRESLFMASREKIKAREPFTLVYMDLDQFKSVNDTYGHLVGDAYIRRFAAETNTALGKSGSLYRVYGDEFICLYFGDDLDRFLSEVAAQTWRLPMMVQPFLGISVGLAAYPADGTDMDLLIALADKKMYEKKKTHAEIKEA